MHVSYAVSRLLNHNSKNVNKQEVKGLNVLVSEVSPMLSNITLDMFQKETASDEALSLFKTFCNVWLA